MALIGQVSVVRLKDLSTKMWNKGLESENACILVFNVVGTVKVFDKQTVRI